MLVCISRIIPYSFHPGHWKPFQLIACTLFKNVADENLILVKYMNFQGAIKTIRTEGTARIMVPEITATQSFSGQSC